MDQEERKRRFNEAVVNMLYPQKPKPSSEDDVKSVHIPRQDLELDPQVNSGDLENEGGSTSDGDGGELDTQKLSRAQRKRLRRKKLKEEASRRGKIIGPLPLALSVNHDNEYICSVATESPAVRRNVPQELDTGEDVKTASVYWTPIVLGTQQPSTAANHKLKQRRMAKKLAKGKQISFVSNNGVQL